MLSALNEFGFYSDEGHGLIKALEALENVSENRVLLRGQERSQLTAEGTQMAMDADVGMSIDLVARALPQPQGLAVDAMFHVHRCPVNEFEINFADRRWRSCYP